MLILCTASIPGYCILLSLQNAVSQFYFLSCSGPDVTQAGMAQVQCVARNPICAGNPSVNVGTAVEQYVAQLNMPPPTETGVGFCATSIM